MGVSLHLGTQVRQAEGVTLWPYGACAAILLPYVWFLMLDPGTVQRLSQEDGIVENCGAAFSLIAACLFLTCYLRSEGHGNSSFGVKTKRNVWFLGLAFLMVVAAGEEISWGQRIFSWQTPDAYEELNMQGETNIHNLWFMHGTYVDGTSKSNLALLLNANSSTPSSG
jgi:hypothetical protein